jgi:HD-GYP domain-containing protein (c-di-GMP phosphodiesterase class II)
MSGGPGEIVNLLTRGIQAAGVYFPEHPRVADAATRLAAEFDRALAARDADRFVLCVVDRRLVFEGRFLLGPTLMAKKLIDRAEQFKSGGFVFRRGVAASELTAFFALCGASRTRVESVEEARRLFASRGILSVELPAQGTDADRAGAPGPRLDDVPSARPVQELGGAISTYQHLRESVEGSLALAEAGRSPDLEECRTTVESMLADVTARPADVLHLARYPDYDSYTIGHSVRVALLALLVGRRLGADERALLDIGTACLLHDVGKSRVPHEILFKRGRLDADERRRMSAHSMDGAKILLGTPTAGPLAIAAAFGHHLRHDGCGYPAIEPWQRRGRSTSLVQACDVFEALTAIRPYKPALLPSRALEIMLGDRGAFDPWALSALVATVGLYPPGSRVRLDTGEQAIVLRAGAHLARPVVELSRGADGRALSAADRLVVDLSEPRNNCERRVEEIVFDDVVDEVVHADAADEAAAAEDADVVPCCTPQAHAH